MFGDPMTFEGSSESRRLRDVCLPWHPLGTADCDNPMPPHAVHLRGDQGPHRSPQTFAWPRASLTIISSDLLTSSA